MPTFDECIDLAAAAFAEVLAELEMERTDESARVLLQDTLLTERSKS